MRKTVLEALNTALHTSLEADPTVYFLGEDILDPYGGAFKVAKGLSTKFPDRVISTPISEAGIVGVATGMAMRGLRPVVEIMFGDFITLIADQVINHASKFRWMYNDEVQVPIVIRTPMGGRRGYGPTHSQSLEKIFLGIPGLNVVAPNSILPPDKLLLAAIEDNDPVVFIEHKLLYPIDLIDETSPELEDYTLETSESGYPTLTLRSNSKAQVTVATYGYNLELVLPAVNELIMEHEIFCDIVVFSQLSPVDISPLQKSINRTKRLLTVEEGTLCHGWGTEIIVKSNESCDLVARGRVAARDFPIGNSRTLEDSILPSKNDIVQSILAL